MTDRQAFVAAIRDHPRDTLIRLAFADWLEEHGDAPRAAFARHQVEADRLRPGTAERLSHLDAADALEREHEAEWLGAWRDRLVDWEFRGGCVTRVRITLSAWREFGAELFAWEPAGRVEIVSDSGVQLNSADVRASLRVPAFRQVRECGAVVRRGVGPAASVLPMGVWAEKLPLSAGALRGFYPVTDGEELDPSQARPGEPIRVGITYPEGLFRAAQVRSLSRLDLSGIQFQYPHSDLGNLITNAPFAPALRTLRLRNCQLTMSDIQAIAGCAALKNLRGFHIDTRATSESWSALFNSPHLRNVRSLTVPALRLSEYARSAMARRVKRLTVAGSPDENRDATRWAWRRLVKRGRRPQSLTWERHFPAASVVQYISESGWLGELHTLKLVGSPGRRERTAIRDWFDARRLPRLARLALIDCWLGTHLAEWSGLATLETVAMTSVVYNGRLGAGQLGENPLAAARSVSGVRVGNDRGLEILAASLPSTTRLAIGVVPDGFNHDAPDRVSRVGVYEFARSQLAARLTSLSVRFSRNPVASSAFLTAFAGPETFARLRSLTVTLDPGLAANPEQVAAVRARFGPRFLMVTG